MADKRIEEMRLLAIALHKKFCADNHTDACGWYYEAFTSHHGDKVEEMRPGHSWTEGAHKRWYDKAVDIHRQHNLIFALDAEAR